jgi:hypothetical protein
VAINRLGVVAALAALGWLSGACQEALDPAPSDPAVETTSVEETQAPPEWLSLEVRYSPRHSLGKRRLDVLTTNEGPAGIVVTSIALRTDHFQPLAPEVKNSSIRPGATVAVKADFGPLAGCEPGQQLEATVLMDVSIDAAHPISFRAPLDPEPLDRIREVECTEMAVRQAVGVAFGDGWTREGSTIRAELVLTHLEGEEEVVIEAVGGMILFGMQPRPEGNLLPAILEPDADPLSVPVDLVLIRCDVHAVSQAPDGYAFRVWIAVGGREPFALTVLAPPSLQNQLEELVDECIGV